MSAQPQLLHQQQQQQQSQPSAAYDHRADELAELIVYVSDMRRSFGRQLDAQLHIIQQQQERMQLQCRTIDEQREYIDELAWQIRDLRDSIRRVKESLATTQQQQQQQQQQTASSWPSVAVTALPQPAPRRHQFGGDQPATVGRSRITIEEIIDSSDDEVHQHNNTNDAHTDENIYEAIEVINTQRSTPLLQPRLPTPPTPTPHAPRNSLNADSGTAETRERRARYALTRNRLTYRTSLPPIADDEAGGALAAAIAQLQVQLRRDNDNVDEARESLACGRLSEMSALDGFEPVLLRAAEQRSFRRNSQRGSSKVACSMVPNIEEEYLPDEDNNDDGDRATSNGMPTGGQENGHGGSGGSKVSGDSVLGTSSCAIGDAAHRDVNSAPSYQLPPTHKRGQLDK